MNIIIRKGVIAEEKKKKPALLTKTCLPEEICSGPKCRVHQICCVSGLEITFLTYFPHDSAWICMEKQKQIPKPIKNITFYFKKPGSIFVECQNLSKKTWAHFC